MKRILLPRQVAATIWAGLSALTIAAGFVYRNARISAPYPPPFQEALKEADESAQLQRWLSDLDMLRELSKNQTYPEVGGLIVAPVVLPVKDQLAEETATVGVPSLIFLQVAGRSTAMLGSKILRVGQTLDNGDVVQNIGKTFVVVKTGIGNNRTISMSAQFMPRNIRQE